MSKWLKTAPDTIKTPRKADPAQSPHPTITMQPTLPNPNQGELKKDRKPSVHLFLTHNRRFSQRRRGFSLIEILVVVSIIALLLGIGTAVSIKMTVEARRTQVRAMLEGLKGTNEEFKFLQKSSVNHEGTLPINWSLVTNGASMSSSERFVYACQQNTTLDTMLIAALKSGSEAAFERTFQDGPNGNGFNGIFDRWGTEIEFRTANNGTGSGPATGVANNLLPVTQAPLFVSAGPDKEFGTDDDISTEDDL